jgi:hypothetical protein
MYVRALEGGGGGGGGGGVIRTLGNLITGLHVTSGVFQFVFQSKHSDLVFVFVCCIKQVRKIVCVVKHLRHVCSLGISPAS